MTGPDINPETVGRYRPNILSFSPFWGPDPAQTFGLGQNWPDPSEMNYVQNVNSKFTFYMQLCSCSPRSGAGGNLAGGEAVDVTDLE
jgi:hypothetical protein